ncbi:hypothetical protein MRX96_037069 [Rhipicephalus microplus]
MVAVGESPCLSEQCVVPNTVVQDEEAAAESYLMGGAGVCPEQDVRRHRDCAVELRSRAEPTHGSQPGRNVAELLSSRCQSLGRRGSLQLDLVHEFDASTGIQEVILHG